MVTLIEKVNENAKSKNKMCSKSKQDVKERSRLTMIVRVSFWLAYRHMFAHVPIPVHGLQFRLLVAKGSMNEREEVQLVKRESKW